MGHNVFREINNITTKETYEEILRTLEELQVEYDDCYWECEDDNTIQFTRYESYSMNFAEYFKEKGIKGNFDINEQYIDEWHNTIEYNEE